MTKTRLTEASGHDRNRRAFTLIELLVVITIIVVLLALLTPALDRAIYQAELVVCGTRIKAIGTSGLTYAFENKRAYLYRPGPRDPDRGWEVYKIQDIFEANADYDDRPRLTHLMNMNVNAMLDEPLSETVDMLNTDVDSYVHAGYYLWFGFQYHNRQGGVTYQGTRAGYNAGSSSGMFKMGNRIAWREAPTLGGTPGASGAIYRLSFLASDYHVVANGNAFAWTNHPDRQGNLNAVWRQDAAKEPTDPAFATDIGTNGTFSRWEGPIGNGLMDLNYGYEDGSVRRLDAVEGHDDRMAKVPHYNISYDRAYPTHYSQVPKS